MKKLVLGIIIIFILVCFIGCFDPPLGDVRSSKTTDFGHYNSFVINKLEENAVLFPIVPPSGCQASEYAYRYICSLLSDAGFYINVTIAYGDKEAFDAEQYRIFQNSVSQIKADGEEVYYLGCDVGQNIDLFFDNKIFDGMFFWLETVKTDAASREITYSVALWWDYMEKDDAVTEIAKTVKGFYLE